MHGMFTLWEFSSMSDKLVKSKFKLKVDICLPFIAIFMLVSLSNCFSKSSYTIYNEVNDTIIQDITVYLSIYI